MKYLLPQGLGDSCWALTKIEAINAKLAPTESIDVFLTCSERNPLQDRALDFLRRFEFVSSVTMRQNYGLLRNDGTDRPPFTIDGYWDYIEDGMYEFAGEKYCVLIPNAPLERGIRLEQWLPHYAINWNIFDRFRITSRERAYGATIRAKTGPYAVFYPGPLHGNTLEGHNRNMLWKPQDWVALGERIHTELGLAIVAVGASYDYDYYTHFLVPKLNGASSHWIDLIGRTTLGELFAVTNNAKFVIAYQSGVGIVASYLGTPTAMWWRPRGDSISQAGFLSFENEMSTSWVPPHVLESGAYLPLIYKESDVGYIMEQIKSRKWAE